MKRFWREVSVAADESSDFGGWRVALDGRPIRTQQGAPQIVPTVALAEALAAEWRAQGETIDPAGFVFRDLTDYAIDVVAPTRAEAIARILAYAESDTLCYRGEPDEPLGIRQRAEWEPLLKAAEARHGVRFERVTGIIHRAQPVATLAALRAVLEARDVFTLAALNTLASLAASLVIALAALDEDAEAEALWAAANLEEDWQAEQWGIDAEAQALRARRLAEFTAAIRFATLARS